MSKEDNKTRITNALAAVAAGALTNIFCDELLGGKFEGEIIDGSVWLVKVPYLNFWCRAGQVTPPAKTPSAEEQTIRIRELERENAGLRTANNILKDALGFFAQDRKK